MTWALVLAFAFAFAGRSVNPGVGGTEGPSSSCLEPCLSFSFVGDARSFSLSFTNRAGAGRSDGVLNTLAVGLATVLLARFRPGDAPA